MQSYPTPPEAIHVEQMGPHFTKVHLPGGPVHIFTEPDTGPAHDHPWPLTTHILAGGYVEEEFVLHADGTHSVITHERRPGTSHQVQAGTVHRIVALPAGFCVTRAEPGPKQQEPGFYEFRPDGTYHRYWYEPEYQRWPRG